MTAGLAPQRDDFARCRQAVLAAMRTPGSGNHVNGERTGTGGGRGWQWRMDALAATMIVAAVLPAAYTASAPASSHQLRGGLLPGARQSYQRGSGAPVPGHVIPAYDRTRGTTGPAWAAYPGQRETEARQHAAGP